MSKLLVRLFYYKFLLTNMPQSVCSSVNETLGHFQFLTMTNNIPMNLLKHVLPQVVHTYLWVPGREAIRLWSRHGLYWNSVWQRPSHPWPVSSASHPGDCFSSSFRGVLRITQNAVRWGNVWEVSVNCSLAYLSCFSQSLCMNLP